MCRIVAPALLELFGGSQLCRRRIQHAIAVPGMNSAVDRPLFLIGER
jgi:hypothetical protein